jgi:hypothetical protein
LPLYIVNWILPASERWDLLNLNKLLRLFKVPRQLHALETRYLKRTMELRLFKLLYYTFMLSHVFGCLWFNFASKVAVPNFSKDLLPESKKTAFGESRWVPRAELEHAPYTLQYTASLYWSLGLMSASSEAEFPTTIPHSFFSVITMTTGFFLFAYVLGNFTDIIELTTSEAREFNSKMGAVRQLLNHFQLPETLQERLKTFYLFKRFHTITQEHILEQCLPPSLLRHPPCPPEAHDREGGISQRHGRLRHAHAGLSVHADSRVSRRIRLQARRTEQRHVLRLHWRVGRSSTVRDHERRHKSEGPD